MRTWSINRERVDWDSVEAIAFRQADGAESAADTYPAVETALKSLRDDHSFFLTPSEARLLFDGTARFDTPIVEVRPDGLGYVSIGMFRGNIGEQADAYARSLATEIADSATRACGWIVDLRENVGGNMWPMVAGLAPLLGGEGEIGSFTYPDGTVEPWRLEGGIAWWNDQPMTTFEARSVRLRGILIPDGRPTGCTQHKREPRMVTTRVEPGPYRPVTFLARTNSAGLNPGPRSLPVPSGESEKSIDCS